MTVAEPAISWMMRRDETPVDIKSSSFMENLVNEATDSVRYLAKRLASRLPAHVDVEDPYQMGMIGLLQSVDRFDDSRGIKFQTYANRRVQGAMLDYLRSLDWRPRSVRRRNREIAVAVSTVEQRLGGSASTEEITAQMDISMDEYHQWMSEGSIPRAGEFIHSDAHASSSSDDFMNTIADSSATPEQAVLSEQMQAVLSKAIDHLPENERLVMSLYYYEQVPMRDIGEHLGVKQARVSQLHSQALRRLRLRMQNNRPFGQTADQPVPVLARQTPAIVMTPRQPAARVATISRRKTIVRRDLAPAA